MDDFAVSCAVALSAVVAVGLRFEMLLSQDLLNA